MVRQYWCFRFSDFRRVSTDSEYFEQARRRIVHVFPQDGKHARPDELLLTERHVEAIQDQRDGDGGAGEEVAGVPGAQFRGQRIKHAEVINEITAGVGRCYYACAQLTRDGFGSLQS